MSDSTSSESSRSHFQKLHELTKKNVEIVAQLEKETIGRNACRQLRLFFSPFQVARELFDALLRGAAAFLFRAQAA